jgi:hypothetical protein
VRPEIRFAIICWALGFVVFLLAWIPAGMPVLPAFIFFGPLLLTLITLNVRDWFITQTRRRLDQSFGSRPISHARFTLPGGDLSGPVLSISCENIRISYDCSSGGRIFPVITCGRMIAPANVMSTFVREYSDISRPRGPLRFECADGRIFEFKEPMLTRVGAIVDVGLGPSALRTCMGANITARGIDDVPTLAPAPASAILTA